MTDLLTVCTWFWVQPNGRTKYTPEHVALWAAMVRRNLTMPHRIAVVTHENIEIEGVEIIRPPQEFDDVRIQTWNERRPQCHRRLVMFRPDADRWFGKRFASMDLDCVIGGPLDPIFDREDDIILFKGTMRNRPYNGSLLLMSAGARPQVYNDFTEKAAAEAGRLFCGSDQAWLMHKLGPNEKVWDDRDGVYWFGGAYRTRRDRAEPRILFFPGSLKPWDVLKIDPFAREHYHLDMMEAAA